MQHKTLDTDVFCYRSLQNTYHLIDRGYYDTKTCIDSSNPVEFNIIIRIQKYTNYNWNL